MLRRYFLRVASATELRLAFVADLCESGRVPWNLYVEVNDSPMTRCEELGIAKAVLNVSCIARRPSRPRRLQ